MSVGPPPLPCGCGCGWGAGVFLPAVVVGVALFLVVAFPMKKKLKATKKPNENQSERHGTPKNHPSVTLTRSYYQSYISMACVCYMYTHIRYLALGSSVSWGMYHAYLARLP